MAGDIREPFEVGIGTGKILVEEQLGVLPEFSFDSTLIESAIVNLLANAEEAMPAGGRWVCLEPWRGFTWPGRTTGV